MRHDHIVENDPLHDRNERIDPLSSHRRAERHEDVAFVGSHKRP